MFGISTSGIVTVNRGDSFELPVSLILGSVMSPTCYKLQNSDVLYLGIMEPNQPFETAIVRKMIRGSDVQDRCHPVFRFWPTDTSCLLPGKYYYQIKLETTDPESNKTDVETIVDKTLFYIQE